MKAISFLGLARYSETCYVYHHDGEERTCVTPFFAEALPHFFPNIDCVYVLVTPTVSSHENLSALHERLGDLLEEVPIPEGHSEAELWEIFNALVASVPDGEEVVFDITNSFRSLPFLTFLAAALLRGAQRVKLKAIIYGAFEARDKETNRTPVFDLTPFVTLLDWLTATNQFIYTGDARYLARLLTREGAMRHSSVLKKAGNQLQSLSLAMMLCRPLEVMEEAGNLKGALRRAEPELSQWAQPFGLLAERIQAEYAARSLPQPTAPDNVAANLTQQLALIHWYLDNNQIIQAMSLAREWIVTAVGYRLGQDFALGVKEREQLGRGVEGLSRLRSKRCVADDVNEIGQQLLTWSEEEQKALTQLWAMLTGVRNDLDHVGMNPGPSKAAKLARKAREKIWASLETLAELWHLS